MSQANQTMLAVLLVVGLVVGSGIGYFMAAPYENGDSSNYQAGYDDGYEQGLEDRSPSYSSSSDSEDTQGLYTLIYGAIGASLVAALASITCLMQVSRRYS